MGKSRLILSQWVQKINRSTRCSNTRWHCHHTRANLLRKEENVLIDEGRWVGKNRDLEKCVSVKATVKTCAVFLMWCEESVESKRKSLRTCVNRKRAVRKLRTRLRTPSVSSVPICRGFGKWPIQNQKANGIFSLNPKLGSQAIDPTIFVRTKWKNVVLGLLLCSGTVGLSF